MASVRAELLAYFTHILLGDALAAEYLILHLISNVYVKVNLEVLVWLHAKARGAVSNSLPG